MLVLKKIHVKKIWVQKILGPKNIWKKFESKKNFGFEKKFGEKKIRFQKNV